MEEKNKTKKVDLVGDEWKMAIPDLCQRYSTNVDTGLTSAQVKLNKKTYGKNELKEKKDKLDKKSKDEKKSKDNKETKEPKKDKDGKDKVKKTVSVIRDGQTEVIPVKKLVVGDIVELQAGQEVPADLRIIVANDLKVDPKEITAEFEKTLGVECTHDNPLETSNAAYLRFKVVNGSGKGIVIAVGQSTIAAQLPKPAPLSQ